MNRLINSKLRSIVLAVMVLSSAFTYAAVDDFELSVRNITQTAPNRLEFDLYLLDTDPGQVFELASCQFGFLLNSFIYNGGTLSVVIDNTGSGLIAGQQFISSPGVVSSLSGYPGQTLIRLAGNTPPPVPPGAGVGTVISTSGNGTLLTHFILTSTVDFTPNSTPNLIFCSSSDVSPLYATKLGQFIAGDESPLTVTPGTDAIVYGNPVLNQTPPASFTVTGGGSYCEGGAGLPVGLAGSEAGVTYTLYRGATEVINCFRDRSCSFIWKPDRRHLHCHRHQSVRDNQYGGAGRDYCSNQYCSAASATPTLCINTALTPVTHTTTGATGIGTATGLPSGVTAAWAANTITISGTPTASGVFTYSIPLTGGCGTVNATGTITVTAANTVSAASSTPTLCINTALTPITHTTTGATGIGTATGLPSGVTAAWATNTITISGTPTAVRSIYIQHSVDRGLWHSECHRYDNGYSCQYSQCGLLNPDTVYQYGTDPDNTYDYRGDRYRYSHRITIRSNCRLGSEYYHHQWYTNSIRSIYITASH